LGGVLDFSIADSDWLSLFDFFGINGGGDSILWVGSFVSVGVLWCVGICGLIG
jgi:hypothetical protein